MLRLCIFIYTSLIQSVLFLTNLNLHVIYLNVNILKYNFLDESFRAQHDACYAQCFSLSCFIDINWIVNFEKSDLKKLAYFHAHIYRKCQMLVSLIQCQVIILPLIRGFRC